MFISGESYKEAELEKYCDYESIEVPDSYTGPHLSFPLLPDHATALLEAFQQKQVRIPKRYHALPFSEQGCRIDNLVLTFLPSSVDWSITSWLAVKQNGVGNYMIFPNAIEMFFLKIYS